MARIDAVSRRSGIWCYRKRRDLHISGRELRGEGLEHQLVAQVGGADPGRNGG
ncbi:MAG TPA: hypothetical protein VIR30_10725 [Nocardioides sp.]